VHRIFAGTAPGQPPPPLAGALAAFLARRGDVVQVVDPIGGSISADGDGPLWVHVDDAGSLSRADVTNQAGPITLFGAVHRLGDALPADADAIEGCALPRFAPLDDLDALPITTWAGFGLCGPAFRLLAGRGDDRVRSVRHVLREVVYLAETWKAGHLMFDDEDLGRYDGWADAFAAELSHLPWRLSWEATIGGRRRHRP